MSLSIPLRRFISLTLDIAIGVYVYSFLSLILKVWFDIDIGLDVRVADLRNPIIFFLLAVFARFALGVAKRGGDLPRKLLTTVTGVYALIIAAFLVWGKIDFSIPVAEAHPLLWDYPLFLGVCLLRLALWLVDNRHESASRSVKPGQLERSHYAVIGAIFLCAVLLRFWGVGQGLADEFLHPDAYKQVEAAYQYMNSNYSFDLEFKDEHHTAGYPYFSMHAPALIAKAIMYVSGFAGFDFAVDITFLMKICRALSFVYSLVVLGILFTIGVRHFGLGAGALALFLLSLTLLQIHSAKFIGADLPMSMYALAALYFALNNLIEEKKWNYLWAGVFAGLAACAKYNGLLTVIFILALYLAKRDGVKDAIRSATLPGLSALAMAVTVMLVTPNIWADPIEGLQAIRNAMIYSSNYAIDAASGKLGLFWEMRGYNAWALEGMITPLHWLPALVGYVTAFVFTPKRFWALFLSPVLIFAIGKYGMPMSSPTHFMLIQPLMILVVAVGYAEMWRRSKFARLALAGAAVLYFPLVAWRAVDDTSMWSIRQTEPTAVEWINQNIEADTLHWEKQANTVDNLGQFNKKLESGAALADFHFREPPPPTLQRNQRNIIWRPAGATVAPPHSHFATDAEVSVIFAGVTDIVTTENYFSLGKDGVFAKERLITDDIKDKEIYLHIKNGSAENRLACDVAGKAVDVSLKPFGEWTGAFELAAKTRLYYGQFYSVKCAAEKDAAVAIAISDVEKGLLLQSEGKIDDAKKAYLKSQDATVRLRSLSLADSYKEASAIADEIALLNAVSKAFDITADVVNVSAATLKGDLLFENRMTRPVANLVNDAVDRTDFAWRVNPGGLIYGPYMPLMAGEYEASVRYFSDSAGVQFVVDVVSEYGKKTLATKAITHEGEGVIDIVLPFTITDYLEYPVEVRIHDVKEGGISFLGASMKNDYKKQRNGLIKAAMDKFSSLRQPRDQHDKVAR